MVLDANPSNFDNYLSILSVIMTVLSVATFSFILPKAFDHFNNRNYRNYKEMLDLRKALIDNNRPVDKSIDEYIDTYEKDFLTNRAKKNKSKDTFYTDALQILCFIIMTTGILLCAAVFIYYQFLNIAIDKGKIFTEGIPFNKSLVDIFTQIYVVIYHLLHHFTHLLHFC